MALFRSEQHPLSRNAAGLKKEAEKNMKRKKHLKDDFVQVLC